MTVLSASTLERVRAGLGRRAVGFSLALLLEGLLVLLLLTLSPRPVPPKVERDVAVFNVSPEPEASPADPEPTPEQARERPATDPAVPEPPAASAAPPATTQPQPAPPPWIELSRKQMTTADIAPSAPPPARPPRPAAGPPDTGIPGDTARVGTGSNGQPLYAAAWYREPYEGELRGYLSTADGPGWGLIACRTAPDFRVEDCVEEGEYPEGSKIARAVLAAAWQFRVRPPRVGGQAKIGEWVRIRIDYDLRRR